MKGPPRNETLFGFFAVNFEVFCRFFFVVCEGWVIFLLFVGLT